jgi:photosystem II stability/assembly factor-like uncharacterized protein
VIFLALLALAQWQTQTSGTTASLRGISAVTEKVVWASGAKGTVLRTLDGGVTWTTLNAPGSEALDFRGIHAFSAESAVIMSAGPGALSRVYVTSDGGAHWKLTHTNMGEKGFYDGIAFWDAKRGMIVGDSVDGRMAVLRTNDGGLSWTQVDKINLPEALPGEGAFAASNTSLFLQGKGKAWFATGSAKSARVYRSADWGDTWKVAETPVRHDGQDSGIFSISFRDDQNGVIVGGKHSSPQEREANIALTSDGGATWKTPATGSPSGFRSAVVAAAKGGFLLTTGTSGTEISTDNGATWAPSGTAGFNAMSTAGNYVWACGSKGAIAVLRLK